MRKLLMITALANHDLKSKFGLHCKTPINMAFYDKSDLRYDYNWTENSEIDLEKKPLNPDEGYEVLYFINGFAEKHRFVNKITGSIIERLIKNHLPPDLNSHTKIMEWLENSG
ncbi:hypothetical protein [uncultured Flavobacterium sp.]|uniref:hypothetical protein n=1 Tax=uncultured Flavobacterium sp. TaxID=165435 RepID=UPI0025E3208D|nr:hypothetical protein [uncultured Flavobacterium sp.]